MSEDYQKSAKDSLAQFIIFTGLIVGLVWLFPEVYQGPWWLLKKIEVEFVLFFSNLFPPEFVKDTYKIKVLLSKYAIGDYRFSGMLNTDAYTQYRIGWVFNLILILVGFKLIRTNAEKFNKRHDLESLLEVTSRYWRFNRYLLTYNPSKISKLDLGCPTSNFRVRDKPIEYLVSKEVLSLLGKKYSINKQKLHTDSVNVLGDFYTDVDSFNREELVIFAGLALITGGKPYHRGFKGLLVDLVSNLSIITNREFYKRWVKAKVVEIAVNLYGDMSECYNKERDFDEVEVYAKAMALHAIRNPLVSTLCEQHAFKRTLLRRLLAEARNNAGVLPASYFGWIAITDRVLFVSMSDEGMGESSAETYAIKNHYMFEVLMQKPVFEIDIERHSSYIDSYMRKKDFTKKLE